MLLEFMPEDQEQAEWLKSVCSDSDEEAFSCPLAARKWREAYQDSEKLFGDVESLREIYADLNAEMAVLRIAVGVAGPMQDQQLRKRLQETRRMILQLIKQVGKPVSPNTPLTVAGRKVPPVREDLLRKKS